MESMPEIIKSDIELLISNIKSARFSNNIIKCILFGSFASGKYQPDSDLDVAVVIKTKPEKCELADYYMLSDGLNRTTDLLFCTMNELDSNKKVFAEILREGVMFYENIC